MTVRDQVEFLNLVAAAADDELLGFHLAQHCELRAIGLYYYVLASSETVMDVFQRAARYSTLVNEGVVQKFIDGRIIGIRQLHRREPHRDRHQVEFWTATIVLLKFTGVRVIHSGCASLTRNARRTRDNSLLRLQRRIWRRVDEILFGGSGPTAGRERGSVSQRLLVICEEAIAHRAANRGSVRTRVENEIAASLPHGKARAAHREALELSQRTLARHLAEEGTTFSKC